MPNGSLIWGDRPDLEGNQQSNHTHAGADMTKSSTRDEVYGYGKKGVSLGKVIMWIIGAIVLGVVISKIAGAQTTTPAQGAKVYLRMGADPTDKNRQPTADEKLVVLEEDICDSGWSSGSGKRVAGCYPSGSVAIVNKATGLVVAMLGCGNNPRDQHKVSGKEIVVAQAAAPAPADSAKAKLDSALAKAKAIVAAAQADSAANKGASGDNNSPTVGCCPPPTNLADATMTTTMLFDTLEECIVTLINAGGTFDKASGVCLKARKEESVRSKSVGNSAAKAEQHVHSDSCGHGYYGRISGRIGGTGRCRSQSMPGYVFEC
jgi:hypothetical protein